MAYKERPLKYPDLDSIRQLRNSGRELLGTFLYATEKRDGSNITIWTRNFPNDLPYASGVVTQISSRNTTYYCLTCQKVWGDKEEHVTKTGHTEFIPDIAEHTLENRVKSALPFSGITQMLKDNPTWVVFAESIPAGRGPTRIEPAHKYQNLVVFDIWEGGRFFSYNFLYQQCYHYHVPVVKLIGQGTFESMDTLGLWVKDMLAYSKRHRREGVVIKAYGADTQVFAKEKIDMPERPKFTHSGGQNVELPPLPDSEIYGAIDKVLTDYGMDFLRDKRQAMPKVAEYVQYECKKHLCSLPKGSPLYSFYINFLAAKQI